MLPCCLSHADRRHWRLDDRVDSTSRWRPLKVAVAEAGGWKPAAVAGKLDSMLHSLSARAHDVRALQGLEREAVVISAKVLSGKCAYTH